MAVRKRQVARKTMTSARDRVVKVVNVIDVRGEVCKIISEMLDNPDEYGIYPTTRCYDKLESFIKSYGKICAALARSQRRRGRGK
jgi:hypothetical protein